MFKSFFKTNVVYIAILVLVFLFVNQIRTPVFSSSPKKIVISGNLLRVITGYSVANMPIRQEIEEPTVQEPMVQEPVAEPEAPKQEPVPVVEVCQCCQGTLEIIGTLPCPRCQRDRFVGDVLEIVKRFSVPERQHLLEMVNPPQLQIPELKPPVQEHKEEPKQEPPQEVVREPRFIPYNEFMATYDGKSTFIVLVTDTENCAPCRRIHDLLAYYVLSSPESMDIVVYNTNLRNRRQFQNDMYKFGKTLENGNKLLLGGVPGLIKYEGTDQLGPTGQKGYRHLGQWDNSNFNLPENELIQTLLDFCKK